MNNNNPWEKSKIDSGRNDLEESPKIKRIYIHLIVISI